MTEIVLDRVSKRFPDGTMAVCEASFTVRDGEFFILVGPSGCGKSTLLNLIVGLDVPSTGEIRIGGRRANEIDARDRNMAMVFQSYALYPHMTVRENLAFPLTLTRMDRAEIRRRVEHAAAVLELTEVLDRRPASLSGGQRQRAAMGRAIVREPTAFLLDEPLSNLDARLRLQMRTEIARLQKRLGTTTIYVTHDQAEAMTLGDRVAVLRGGVVQQIGTPRELYERPANQFVAGFLGSPGMNFLSARIERGRLRLPIGELDLAAPLAAPLADLAAREGPLIVGVRPEHLREARDADEARARSVVFKARADVVEWTGAETFVHFTLNDGTSGGDGSGGDGRGGDARGDGTRGSDARGGGTPGGATCARAVPDAAPSSDDAPERAAASMVARIAGTSRAREEHDIELAVDPGDLHFFDAASGESLARPEREAMSDSMSDSTTAAPSSR